MRRTGFALLLLLSGCAAGAPRSFGPALWSVTSADCTVYLFGTVHVLPLSLPWRTPTVQNAFDDSREIWVETDVNNTYTARAALRARSFDAGAPLVRALSLAGLEKLRVALASCGVPAAKVDHLRPWAAVYAISACAQRHMLPPQGSSAASMANQPDRLLALLAQQGGKPVKYFQSWPSQIAIVADLPDRIWIADLRRGLERAASPPTTPSLRAVAGALEMHWVYGDLDALTMDIARGVAGDDPEVYDAMLTVRNALFVKGIRDILKRPTTAFVAVGAGHFLGDEGIIARLTADGYAVRRLE